MTRKILTLSEFDKVESARTVVQSFKVSPPCNLTNSPQSGLNGLNLICYNAAASVLH